MRITAIPDTEHFKKLTKLASEMPVSPGVYMMKAESGEVIYIGKALNLRARVRSYFKGGDGRYQIEFLMKRVHALEQIVTETEEQALILERDLINKYKPKYNIRLKDDKSYISVRIDKNTDWPRIELVRKVEQDGAIYFGPYIEAGKLRALLDVIKKVIPLRTCSNTVFYNRTRPCLEYQIKRCAGPCALPVEKEEYMQWIDQAIALLQGKTAVFIKSLKEKMESASEKMHFEEAGVLRDRIIALEEYTKGTAQGFHRAESRDYFGMQRQGSEVVIYIIKVRNGRMADSENFTLDNAVISNEELMENVLLQYYRKDREIPEEILLNYLPTGLAFLKKHLREKRGESVEITLPLIGSKKHLLAMANLNAEQTFQTKFRLEENYTRLIEKLSKEFNLRQVPRRIECVDISNFQGSDIVGAIVSFFDGKTDKQNYKKYNISFQGKPDDFKAMHEVVYRRLKRGRENDDLPDLLVIDGGDLQLAKAIEAREELKISLDIIALAKMRNEKKPERVFLEGKKESIHLNPEDELSHFLQRIRDEAHRFVITFHKNKRAKRVFGSVLDDILGLGPERKRRLLRRYGNISLIRGADIQELAKTGRMPLSLAKKVKEYLK
jgi:excinuclease ABC subunit C